MRSDALLNALKGVRSRGNGQYMAQCPAHPDKTASLSVKCCDDGRVLLHCFAGCQPDDVLGAVGLEFSHIMPERLGHDLPKARHVIPASDALRILRREMTLIGIVGSDMLEGRSIDEPTWQRFAEASARVHEIAGWTE